MIADKRVIGGDKPYEPERKAREINRLTNRFMRQLYGAVAKDQETPGVLMDFLQTHPNVTKDPVSGTWVVDFGDV